MQAKVHGSSIYILLTYTYPILSDFEATFCIPSFLTIKGQLARRLIAKLAECPGETNTRSGTNLLCLLACLVFFGSPTSSALLCFALLRYARFDLVGWFALHLLGLSVACHALRDLAALALFAC